ncbi:hypothetical protein THII_0052 [Thioploca ingrica]|uniref:Rpn family recombination-promoting nuclease/putative transposase n=1 Tax=Thioploca ingrica TaxID=40754 RepID=A0A090ACD7_9GAMM|nr:hypothetical protein THII_0052 [Thioploca ingrica]
MKQVASLRYGVIFKKAFCDPEVFKGFVRDILGIQLEIDTVETEKTFSIPLGRIQPRFDLFAEDKKNRIIVDIQHERHADHYDRFLHYHCVALLEQISQSQDYRPALKVFTIVVLTSGDKHKKDVSVINFDPHDLVGNPLNEIPHKIIYLCPKYLNDKTPPTYWEWLQAINDSLDEQVEETHYHLPEIQKIFQHIAKDLLSPQERTRMIEEYHLEELKQSTAQQKAIEIASNLLIKGLPLAMIAEVTGLSATEILTLAELGKLDLSK